MTVTAFDASLAILLTATAFIEISVIAVMPIISGLSLLIASLIPSLPIPSALASRIAASIFSFSSIEAMYAIPMGGCVPMALFVDSGVQVFIFPS